MTSAGSFAAAKEGWLKLVASYPNLSGADMAVAVMLATYMNSKSRDAWPSMETLARDTNRSRSTVWRSLKRLEKLKLLNITHARSRRKPNRYRPALGKLNTEPKRLARATTPRGLMLRTRNVNAANLQLISCELAARTSEEPQNEESKYGLPRRELNLKNLRILSWRRRSRKNATHKQGANTMKRRQRDTETQCPTP